MNHFDSLSLKSTKFTQVKDPDFRLVSRTATNDIKGSHMKLTEVKVFPVNEDRLKAYVTITLDDCFVVRDLKIIMGNTGLFVAMPSKKRKDGQFRDIAHPLDQKTREIMEQQIFDAYEEEIKSMGESLESLKTQQS